MRRQRNMSQMKEQDKSPEKELKMETSYLLHAEFKTLVTRMLSALSEELGSIEKAWKPLETVRNEGYTN